ncbi:predicted nucleic acid-binding Zn ribbon protein [Jatrophihabitans sp. GAS493]|uniref:DciA family protein n=1 Tax=Jatrophihabitans sp. GAS493 TaxID=1907575 RepID=UPI000BB7CE51|nr:DciA family protein [Jatrophihabitans sp. GAS493]SOD71218.1 predicted nucleic acid-binding Zn ribbon protein [Jatrophihabitans sp. GAS493]
MDKSLVNGTPEEPQGNHQNTPDDRETAGIDAEIEQLQANGLSGGDLARAALESARRSASALPAPMGRDARRRSANRQANRRRGGYSGSGPDERDPQSVGGILANLFTERGWDRPLAEARVFADWENLVGAEIAARCQPVLLRDGELKISAESTAWATQLRMMSSSILKRLVGELGPTVVTKLMITGPVGPSWKHGAWSVRGHRGPRDTYG